MFCRSPQPWDLTPTVMDLFDVEKPQSFQGESLIPVVNGKKLKPRPYAFCGSNQSGHWIRQAINANWLYACWPNGERKPWLIDLKGNPKQDKNAVSKNPDVCAKMRRALEKFDPEPFGNG